MNEIKVFDNQDFGQVRMVMNDGKPLFCGIDVARALGYTNPRKALIDHCKGVTKRDTLTAGGMQQISFIPEGDVYRLIVRSKLPSAEKFERWVFDEVLPSIRKTGGYVNDEAQFVENYFPSADEFTKSFLRAQLAEVRAARSEVRQLKPKAEYCETVLQCPGVVTVTTIAKDYGWSAQKLNAWLAQQGIQYKRDNTWQIYRKYAQKGYTKTHTMTYTTHNGEERAVVYTCWTQEGRKFLYELLAQHGILPVRRIAGN